MSFFSVIMEYITQDLGVKDKPLWATHAVYSKRGNLLCYCKRGKRGQFVTRGENRWNGLDSYLEYGEVVKIKDDLCQSNAQAH